MNKPQGGCESCAFYAYDEEYEYYVCEADLDEDEMSAFLRDSAALSATICRPPAFLYRNSGLW